MLRASAATVDLIRLGRFMMGLWFLISERAVERKSSGDRTRRTMTGHERSRPEEVVGKRRGENPRGGRRDV